MDATTMMVIFVVFNMFKRVADQAKNICDQTVFAVRGIAKLPKVYRILFLGEPGSELAQLATAIGRKNFSDTAEFSSATAGGSGPPSDSLTAFLEETGLPGESLESEPLAGLEHDSSLNWIVPEDAVRSDQYRQLRGQISELIALLAGVETTQA